MEYWTEVLLVAKIATLSISVIAVSMVLIAMSSIKRTRLLEKRK